MRNEFNTLHTLARDVKDTLLTRKRQLSADSDSNSLLGVLLLVTLSHRVGVFLEEDICYFIYVKFAAMLGF
jgi:hypothetical protein